MVSKALRRAEAMVRMKGLLRARELVKLRIESASMVNEVF